MTNNTDNNLVVCKNLDKYFSLIGSDKRHWLVLSGTLAEDEIKPCRDRYIFNMHYVPSYDMGAKYSPVTHYFNRGIIGCKPTFKSVVEHLMSRIYGKEYVGIAMRNHWDTPYSKGVQVSYADLTSTDQQS